MTIDQKTLLIRKKAYRYMKIVHTVEDVRKAVQAWKADGKSIGLVPTIGYLHEGHKSLIDKAVAENDHVVVSVFVNPIQFAPTEDLESYPRDLEQDARLCEATVTSLIFNPEPSDMYSPTFSSVIDMSTLTQGLCGKTRPIHFRGVCTVVGKLFNIVEPNRAYFGQKDAQQLAVIKHMVDDLNFNLEIIGCPIVRETDGLAKSSRNTYLSAEERQAALVLSKSLALAEKMIQDGETDTDKLKQAMTDFIEKEAVGELKSYGTFIIDDGFLERRYGSVEHDTKEAPKDNKKSLEETQEAVNSDSMKKTLSQNQESNTGGERFNRNSSFLGEDSPGTAPKPVEYETQPNFPTNVPFHFSINFEEVQRRQSKYHPIEPDDLKRV